MWAFKQHFQKTINKLHDRWGWPGILTVIFYPVITFVTTPIRLAQTLWNCRVLADGQGWGNYPHFCPSSAINSLFYWTVAINLYRYGRRGTSPHLGLGNLSLSNLWHYSLPSLYLYWKAGAVVLLLGMFAWWAGHLVWLDKAGTNPVWIMAVLTLALFSTTFYFQTFVGQNYNVLGWLFMPVGLYAWSTGNWALAALAWLGASLASFTVVVLTGWLAIFYCFQVWSLFPLLTLIPAGLKLFTHFLPSFKSASIIESLSRIAKAIGMTRNNTKYVRQAMMRFDLGRIYLLLLYTQFLMVISIMARIPILVLGSIIIWIVNCRFVRFADDESLQILIFTTASAAVIQSPGANWLSLLSYWLLASPLPRSLGFPLPRRLATVPEFKPFDIRILLSYMERFLKPVQPGERVLMGFNDPQGEYEQIFDGYRLLLEAPLYIASAKGFHFMPDWWGVFQLNYEGAPDFWGREVDEVEKQRKAWKAEYLVVYQTSGNRLNEKWGAAGYQDITHISWAQIQDQLGTFRLNIDSGLDWWLLQKE